MRQWIAALCLLFVVACGGGGGGSDGGGGVVPPASQPITEAEAGRLMTQATFGPTEAGITEVRNAGINTWITQQQGAPLQAQSHVAYLDARLTQLQATNANASLNSNHFYESWWLNSVTGQDQLRQRVKFALSQIFVISLNDPNISTRGAGSYYDMLGANAFGNYRTLLEQVTLHPMMGRYLTYLANQREDTNGTRTPDENYAREVMQLMSIGLQELNIDGSVRTNSSGQPLSTYTQADISGLAKVFTGLSWFHPAPTNSTFFGGSADPNRDIRPMIFYPQYHSLSEKRFLGVTIPANTTADIAGDLRIALDTLYNHPNVGPFIAQRLIQQMVTSNPSGGYVQRVAQVFNNNGSGVRGDMGAVVRAVLTDTEARSAAGLTTANFGKLREPVIRMSTWMRAFGATSQSGNWLINNTSSNQSLGQSPLASPSVFNFWRPGYVPPSTTQLGGQNLFAPEFQIVDEVSVAGYINTMQNAIGNGVGSTPPGGSGPDIRSAYATELPLANDADALVNRMNLLLFNGQISATARTRLLEAVNSVTIPVLGGNVTQAQIDAARLNRVRIAVLLSMASPEFITQR